MLLAHGAELNAKESKKRQTALMWAVAGKYPEIARALIEHGADVRTPAKDGFTPLLFAARGGDLESARMLLEAGANVNESTPKYGAALVVASASGHQELAIYLLQQGADPNAVDGNGATPLHHAVQRGFSALTGIRYDDAYRVRPPNMPELAQALLVHGADPNARIAKWDQRGPDGVPFNMVGATPFFFGSRVGRCRPHADSGGRPCRSEAGGQRDDHAADGCGERSLYRIMRIPGWERKQYGGGAARPGSRQSGRSVGLRRQCGQ